jgi:hypothetical protein
VSETSPAARDLLTTWLGSHDALATATRLVRRRGLSMSPQELVNEAYLRMRRSFDHRQRDTPSLTHPGEAARYGARMLDNLTRDLVRARLRRPQMEQFDDGELGLPHDDDELGRVEHRVLVEQLLRAVARRASDHIACHGCPSEVVAAAALEVVHLVLIGHDGAERGRTWFDQMLNAALERVDPHVATSNAARDQRKSRCGRCAADLLSTSMAELIGDRP